MAASSFNGVGRTTKGEQKSTPSMDSLISQLGAIASKQSTIFTSATTDERHQLQQLLRAAALALEEPFESMQRVVNSPLTLVISRIGQEFGIFSKLANDAAAHNLAELREASGLESGMMESIMDYLCTQNMASEEEPGQYKATELTKLMASPLFKDAVTVYNDNCLPGFAALPTVLGLPEATNAFKYGQGTDENLYGWLESHPVQKAAFHRYMEHHLSSLPTWLEAVDVPTEMGASIASQDIAFVDVGGGAGQQCVAFKSKFPTLPGRVILQDRPTVVEMANVPDGVEKMGYNYLTEQPIKGARIYYFRQIFHNNDDETCLRILQSHAPSMTKESVIIIDDKVLPDEKTSSRSIGMEYTAALSLTMKVLFDARERRESEWRDLFGKAGWEIREIRKFTKFNDAVIIAAPKSLI